MLVPRRVNFPMIFNGRFFSLPDPELWTQHEGANLKLLRIFAKKPKRMRPHNFVGNGVFLFPPLRKSKLGSHETPPPQKKIGAKTSNSTQHLWNHCLVFVYFCCYPPWNGFPLSPKTLMGKRIQVASSLKCLEIIIYPHAGKQTWLSGKSWLFQKDCWWKKSC